jgi:hypothetical protein
MAANLVGKLLQNILRNLAVDFTRRLIHNLETHGIIMIP